MRTDPVAIDFMTEADLDAARAIDDAAFPSDAQAQDRTVRKQSLRDELTRPFARARVARRDSCEVLGYSLSWHVTDEIYLLHVAVAAHARRRGIGRALMNDLLTYAHENGKIRISLEVRKSNFVAIALYESLGFSAFNVRKGYYANGEDAIEMMRVD